MVIYSFGETSKPDRCPSGYSTDVLFLIPWLNYHVHIPEKLYGCRSPVDTPETTSNNLPLVYYPASPIEEDAPEKKLAPPIFPLFFILVNIFLSSPLEQTPRPSVLKASDGVNYWKENTFVSSCRTHTPPPPPPLFSTEARTSWKICHD